MTIHQQRAEWKLPAILCRSGTGAALTGIKKMNPTEKDESAFTGWT
jgi:hypothetical protein